MAILPILFGGNIAFFLKAMAGIEEENTYKFRPGSQKLPTDIDNAWYKVVGVSITANVFTNIFVPHIKAFIRPIKKNLMIKAMKSPALQDDLNKL